MGLLCGKVTCSLSLRGDRAHHELCHRGGPTDPRSEVVALEMFPPANSLKMPPRILPMKEGAPLELLLASPESQSTHRALSRGSAAQDSF